MLAAILASFTILTLATAIIFEIYLHYRPDLFDPRWLAVLLRDVVRASISAMAIVVVVAQADGTVWLAAIPLAVVALTDVPMAVREILKRRAELRRLVELMEQFG